MTRRTIAWLMIIALAPAMVALGFDQTHPQVKAAAEFGDPIPGLTRLEEDLHVRGRRLFRWELWRPDRISKGFNENECSKCHLEPNFGGSNIDPKTYVAVVPDANQVSGWKTFHRLQRNENGRFIEAARPAETRLRRAPALYGLGLLEAIPESDILKLADPSDTNGDGISGRAINVDGKIGRFGWKADINSIEAFTISAFKGELGVNVEAYDRDDFAGLSINQIRAVAFYIRTLSPPSSVAVALKSGFAAFEKAKCTSCHLPSSRTGESNVAALSKKTFAAYTDMLLHDVEGGAELTKDGEPVAAPEFRTPALWGLGSFLGPFWHDGSAKTITDAIAKHGGEAMASKTAFEKLSVQERSDLINFLKSL